MASPWKADESVEENALAVLPVMAQEYFAAGRKLVWSDPKAAELHPFRLATKRFRYTLESFQSVYGKSLRAKLALLKPVQDALGEVNDCVATAEAFDASKEFREYLDKRAEKKTREFCRAWMSGFDLPGQEAKWIRYLSQIKSKKG